MAKVNKDNTFDTFAWLVHREVEKYINDHEAYMEQRKDSLDEFDCKTQKGGENND